ncbi:MAG TPA: cupredoxin domain-containing protein, partial [Nitrospirota bacterium]|nr:cupredoxin domain-containing protein [Nitrospirota bacterium]
MKISKVMIMLSLAFMMAAFTVVTSAADQAGQQGQVVKITAKKFEYSPNEIRIKTGIPTVFEFTSLDRVHGFTVPDLGGIRAT